MIINKFEWIIAWRYLKARRKDKSLSVISGFSLFGIAIGVAVLITVMSVMNGFKKEIIDKIIGFNGEIAISEHHNYLKNSDKIVDIIEKEPEIKFAYPVIEKQILMTNNGKSAGAMIKALSRKDLIKKKIISQNIILGSLNKFSDEEDNILIGYELANRLNLEVGNNVRFISPEGVFRSIIGTIPKTKIYKIVGIFNSGMYQFDSSTAIMSIEAAQRFFDMTEQISFIEVHIPDPMNSAQIMTKFDKIFQNKYKVSDWQMANSGFFKVLEIERITMFSILTLIIIVAVFNIISSLVMLVKDKTSDIAILRSLGANRNSIMKIFMITGSLIGFIGTIIGGILGMSFSLNIDNIKLFLEKITSTKIFDPVLYYLNNLPSDLKLFNVISIMSISMGLSFLVTLYPSYQATKISPAQGIKS